MYLYKALHVHICCSMLFWGMLLHGHNFKCDVLYKPSCSVKINAQGSKGADKELIDYSSSWGCSIMRSTTCTVGSNLPEGRGYATRLLRQQSALAGNAQMPHLLALALFE